MILLAAAVLSCASPAVVDGDTIRCANLGRIRLLGIDAAELHGCRQGRVCAPGDPIAQRDALAKLIEGGPVTVEPITRDRYGRIVGIVRAGSFNTSCAMIKAGAVYVPKWDNGRRVKKECGL